MCGRVFITASVEQLLRAFAFARATDEVKALGNQVPRFNGAPGLEYPIIVRDWDMPGSRFMAARWGFIPTWNKDPKGGRRPIIARSEGVSTSGMFRAAYRSRRALMPVDGFFEWRSTRGEKARQPFAVAMADGKPFAIAAIWESWRDPRLGLDIKTFAVLTCEANELMATIHDRMPVIIAEEHWNRWLLNDDPDPRDLLQPYPADRMKMWPISSKVNNAKNDDPSILDPEADMSPEG